MDDQIRAGEKGVGPLQRLKNLSREEQEFLLEQRKGDKAISVAKLIRQIEARHGIYGLSGPRWSEFVKYFEEQEGIRLADDSVENLESLYAAEELTPQAVHAHCVKVLRVTGLRTGDLKILKYVASEMRKVMEMQESRERWLEERRTKVDAGLGAVYEEIKHIPAAVELYEKILELLPSKEGTE